MSEKMDEPHFEFQLGANDLLQFTTSAISSMATMLERANICSRYELGCRLSANLDAATARPHEQLLIVLGRALQQMERPKMPDLGHGGDDDYGYWPIG